MVGLSFEQVAMMQASADWFLTDLALSPETLCKRGGFWVGWTLVKELLLLMDSSERRRAELADDVLEPCFPPSEWRSRDSQQLSSPRAIRERQIHPKACRVAP